MSSYKARAFCRGAARGIMVKLHLTKPDGVLRPSITAAYGTGRTGKLAAFLARCIPVAAQV